MQSVGSTKRTCSVVRIRYGKFLLTHCMCAIDLHCLLFPLHFSPPAHPLNVSKDVSLPFFCPPAVAPPAPGAAAVVERGLMRGVLSSGGVEGVWSVGEGEVGVIVLVGPSAVPCVSWRRGCVCTSVTAYFIADSDSGNIHTYHRKEHLKTSRMVSFIAPSSEDLWTPTIQLYAHGKGRHCSGCKI